MNNFRNISRFQSSLYRVVERDVNASAKSVDITTICIYDLRSYKVSDCRPLQRLQQQTFSQILLTPNLLIEGNQVYEQMTEVLSVPGFNYFNSGE